MAIVPLWLPCDCDVLEAHSAVLGMQDLQRRFGQAMKSDAVPVYVDSTGATHAPIFGTVNPNLEIGAVGRFADARLDHA